MISTHSIHKTGVTHIASDILKSVCVYEELQKNFKRCLDAGICPKCGGRLEVTCGRDEDIIYKCSVPHCDFKYIDY